MLGFRRQGMKEPDDFERALLLAKAFLMDKGRLGQAVLKSDRLSPAERKELKKLLEQLDFSSTQLAHWVLTRLSKDRKTPPN